MVKKWEYTYLWMQDDKSQFDVVFQKIIELGENGWELVTANAHNGSWMKTGCYIFKRPKE